jgi:hypothetical protein
MLLAPAANVVELQCNPEKHDAGTISASHILFEADVPTISANKGKPSRHSIMYPIRPLDIPTRCSCSAKDDNVDVAGGGDKIDTRPPWRDN